MKKLAGLLLVIVILAGMMSIAVSAISNPADPADVFVTFSDSTGKVILAQEKITVQDKNSDGKFSIDEVLFAAHEAKYEGGAAAGYATANGTYGLYITKLWGDISGNFGYYVNNAMAMGLTDEVKAGDHLNAFVYQVYQFDPVTYETTADSYSYFDKYTASVTQGDSLTVILKAVEFDASFNPVDVAVSGASILIDGVETAYKTDAQGKVTFPIEKTGELLISAKKDGTVLVPPVLKVTAAEKPAAQPETTNTDDATKSPKTGDQSGLYITLILLLGMTTVLAARKLHEA